uniref:hypothetical protein n=1 Tax=Streptomyces sp. NK08204 TaxID=2873260 RepID=UPI001CED3913
AVDGVEVTAPKVRRTRKTVAAAAVAEIPAQATGEPEVKPKARSTRKTATTAPETTEATEAKPKARRTRKAVAAVEAPQA